MSDKILLVKLEELKHRDYIKVGVEHLPKPGLDYSLRMKTWEFRDLRDFRSHKPEPGLANDRPGRG
jgi:hypothetical protein